MMSGQPVSIEIAKKIEADPERFANVWKGSFNSDAYGATLHGTVSALIEAGQLAADEKTIAFIVEDTDYGKSNVEFTAPLFEAEGWTVAAEETVPLGIDSATLRLRDPSLREPPQTTALATLDRAGNAVSITYSNMNHSGVVVPGTGIVLNNQLLLFNPWPGTPNSLAGGKRPVSSMMPTLVLREGRPVVALGASGSTRIPTSLMQVLYHLCVRGLPVDQAVAVPRLHAEGELITADAELEAVAGRVADRLGAGLELLPGRDSKLGVVQCISRLDAERPTAVGDPRAEGAGLVV